MSKQFSQNKVHHHPDPPNRLSIIVETVFSNKVHHYPADPPTNEQKPNQEGVCLSSRHHHKELSLGKGAK